MDRKTLLTTLLIGGGTDAGTAIAQLQHAVSVLDETKADKTGTVALAGNLTPYSADSGATQSVPFNNQGTGCGNGESVIDTGSYAQIKKKLGNTVCVNQIVYTNADWAPSDNGRGTLTDNVWKVFPTSNTKTYAAAKASATMVYYPRHTYLFHYRVLEMSPGVTSAGFGFNSLITSLNSPGDKYFIIDLDRDRTVVQAVISGSSNLETTEYANFTEPYCIDLDVWFGGHDNIPAHLLSHPEDWGKYYSGSLAYNPGQLVNADGSVLASIGRNVWDEEWEVGYWGNDGVFYNNDPTRIATKNLIKVIPNTQYYVQSPSNTAFISEYDYEGNFIRRYARGLPNPITTSANCGYIAVSFNPAYGTTYNHDITISLYYPGESGYDQYYPFSVLAEVDTGSETLRGVEGSRDEKLPNGTIMRNRAVVDLGTLAWTYRTTGGRHIFATSNIPGIALCKDRSVPISAICPKYRAVAQNASWVDGDMSYYDIGSGRVDIVNNAYSDADAFKAAMSGVYLEYPLATPTTEQGTPFSGASADNFAIDDFGSMYWTQSAGVPQGAEIFYPYDYKAAVDTLLNMVDGDVEKLVTETELGAVSDRIPEAPAEDGTYTLKATVADGVKTYAWVADA